MCVTVINVGYGDAILFQLKNGYTALLDGGSALESEFEGDSYRIRSADYLARQQIEHLNAVIISHIHEDHVCGLEAVLQQTVVDHLYVPYPVEPFLKGCELTPASNAPRSVPLYVAALNAYRRILLHAKEKGIPVTVLKAGQVLKFGIDTKMRILAPKSCVVDAYMEIVERAYSLEADTNAVTECLIRLDATSNHTSMLLRFELGDIVFLSAADSCPSEWDEVPEIFFKNVNVLKLPHHGQIDSISESFMKNMPLEYIITTSASDRRYHSANQAVYQKLAAIFPAEHPPHFLLNGDRTTFDQTADDLNFTFVGDLNLVVDTADDPQGLSVTFPDVVIAQGSTLFRNNWWFGQRSGQHTRDSDGPDTVLAIGSTTEGRTVYASFLRGGNEVNEISLEAIHVVEAAADSANKVVDVKNKFAALPIDGVQSNLEGFPGSYDPTVNHIQGYAQYDSCDHTRYSILTHSVGTAPYAHIVAGPKTGSDKWGFKTYLQNWRHPGGVQVMGDYLLVPSEQDASAHIALYDLRSLAVKELRRVETFDLAVSHKAGALGITSYEDKNGIEYYVMIVAHLDGENTVYHVYRALASNGIENARFSEVGSFESDKDFQGFGLITEDGTNDIYMIGLWSPSEGVTFADYAYLYQLNTETWTIGEALQQIHMVSVGGMAGMMGVHFRYGANVYVADDGTLTLSATERNSVLGSSLATNDWIPAIVN